MNSRLSILFLVTLLLSVMLVPRPALAWGASGHRMVSRLAIENLPPEIPAFLRQAKTAAMIGELGREPDRSRGAGVSHDRDLNPGHFINLGDDFAVAGKVSIDPLPATREDYDTALRANGSDEYQSGFLPYSIVDGWLQLRKDFGYWRVAAAMERKAKTRKDRAWFASDRRLREMLIIRDLGYWSHFVADASQPMHVSIHYDGWGDFSNPQDFRTAKGFHAAFEGEFVARNISAADIRQKLGPIRDCACTIQTRTIAYLHDSHTQIEPLFELEKNGGFTNAGTIGKTFATTRLAAAVSELRDMIVAAWQDSINSDVGYPPIPVREAISGKTNPIRSLQGLD